MPRIWLALFLCSCTHAPLIPAPPDIKSHAIIVSDTLAQPLCSGVVIGPHIALTAAHCIGLARRAEDKPITQVVYPWPGKDVALIEVRRLFDAYPATMRLTASAGPLRLAGYGCSHMTKLEVRPLWRDGLRSEQGYMRGRLCPGDSGSGVFDASGFLVAIGTHYFQVTPGWSAGALIAWLN